LDSHLLRAARLAISDRFSALMPSARAFPPLLPNATAAGSLPCSSGVGSRSGFSPVARLSELVGVRGAFGMGHLVETLQESQAKVISFPLREYVNPGDVLSTLITVSPRKNAKLPARENLAWPVFSQLGQLRLSIHLLRVVILTICTGTRPFSSPELCHNQTDPLPAFAP